MAQLGGDKAGLESIEAAVITFDLVVILLGLTVVAKYAHGLSHGLVVSGYGTCFSARAKILSRIKAECGCVAHASRFFPRVCGLGKVLSPMRLASILDNDEIIFASESKNWIHISGLAINMNRNDGGYGRLQLPMDEPAGFRVRGALMLEVLFQLARIQTIGAFVDVDKIGAPTGLAYRLCGCDKGVRNGDENVARFYARRGQCESHRIGSASDH